MIEWLIKSEYLLDGYSNIKNVIIDFYQKIFDSKYLFSD